MTSKRSSDKGFSVLLYGGFALFLAMPLVVTWHVVSRRYDLSGLDRESWYGFAHAFYLVFSIVAIYLLYSAVKGTAGKTRTASIVIGILSAAYLAPLLVFLVTVKGYVAVVLGVTWDTVSDALF